MTTTADSRHTPFGASLLLQALLDTIGFTPERAADLVLKGLSTSQTTTSET